MTTLKKFLLSLFFYCLAGLGISLTIKANIGVSSFNSMNVAISNISHIKVGTITIITNLLFLFGYMVMTRFSMPMKYLIQLVFVSCFGMVINAFTYYFLSGLMTDIYFFNILIFIGGTILAGISTGMVIYFEIITFPIEACCLAVAETTRMPFAKLRYMVDIFSVTVSLFLSFFFHLPYFVREGTLISLFLLSATINLTKEICQKKPVPIAK